MIFVFAIALVLFFIILPILFIIGMFKPAKFQKLYRKKKANRWRILRSTMLAAVLLFIVLGVTAQEESPETKLAREQALSQKAEVAKQEATLTEQKRVADEFTASQQRARKAIETERQLVREAEEEAAKSVKLAEERRQKEIVALRPVVKNETKIETVSFETEEREDDSMPRGETRISISGVDGERTINYDVTYVKEQETDRQETKNEITKAPVTQVILVGTYDKARAAPTSSMYFKGIANKCLDVRWGKAAIRGAVQLYTCNSTGAQKWGTFNDGTVRVQGFCLDVKWGGKSAKTPVWLYECNGSPAQQWQIKDGTRLVNPISGLCLDSKYGGTNDGNGIWIYTCNNTNAQSWRATYIKPKAPSTLKAPQQQRPVTPSPTPAAPRYVTPAPPAPRPQLQSTYYKNCTAVRAAGADPIHIGQPGYARHLDRDGDGIGCE